MTFLCQYIIGLCLSDRPAAALKWMEREAPLLTEAEANGTYALYIDSVRGLEAFYRGDYTKSRALFSELKAKNVPGDLSAPRFESYLAKIAEAETKHTKEMVGTYWISVPTVDENKKLIVSAEAQRIARKFWRTGVNREARNLIYNYLFLTLDVDEIRAQAWDNNINSCRSMEQIGFKLENQVKRLFPKYNELFLENHYVLFREDWFG